MNYHLLLEHPLNNMMIAGVSVSVVVVDHPLNFENSDQQCEVVAVFLALVNDDRRIFAVENNITCTTSCIKSGAVR